MPMTREQKEMLAEADRSLARFQSGLARHLSELDKAAAYRTHSLLQAKRPLNRAFWAEVEQVRARLEELEQLAELARTARA